MYLLLAVAAILFSTQFIFNQRYQKGRGDGIDSSLLFQMYTAFANVIVMLILNQFHMRVTPFSLIIGLIYSVDIILYLHFSLKSFASANLSVYSIFAMLGGMVLPFICGTVFFSEGITVPKIISCIVIAAALVLTYEKGAQSKKAILYYIAVFVFNGMMGVISTVHQSYPEYSTDSRSFIAVAYAGVFVISTVWYLARNKKLTFLKPVELTYTSLYAVFGGIAELFLLISLTKLPASVQYPVVTGGTILFSTVVSFIMEKKVSKRSALSALLALAATIVIIL
ncbi:MAG: hypothetical protein E7672_05830 [Ruminococcaceae bacterium]|nr:hypothetical protein [Oscillospiraceae bacterium]